MSHAHWAKHKDRHSRDRKSVVMFAAFTLFYLFIFLNFAMFFFPYSFDDLWAVHRICDLSLLNQTPRL